MADAKKCDRCNNFYMPDDIEMYSIKRIIAIISTGTGETNKTYDLCPECAKKLKDFMNNLRNKAETKGEE